MHDEKSERRNPNVLTQRQFFALAAETEAVVELSRRGIEELWRLDGSNDFVHLSLQLLAQGFERLLKLTYALAWLKRYGDVPPPSKFRGKGGFGHNVVLLTDELAALVETVAEYASRPAVQDDLAFIRSDTLLRRHLQLLSAFGTWSRYYRFDEFLGMEHSDDDDPDRLWSQLEMEILQTTDGGLGLLSSPGSTQQIHAIINQRITAVLERFARAITRMWTLGALHLEARRMTGLLRSFLYLHDRELGEHPSQHRLR